MLANLKTLLSYIPGEVASQVNLLQLGEVVAQAELNGFGVGPAITALIDQQEAVFIDPTTRPLYVQILTVAGNLLAHQPTPTKVANAAPISGPTGGPAK